MQISLLKEFISKNTFKAKVLKKFKLKIQKNIKDNLKKIFKNSKLLLKLEKIIHPLVRKEIKRFSLKNNKKTFFVF